MDLKELIDGGHRLSFYCPPQIFGDPLVANHRAAKARGLPALHRFNRPDFSDNRPVAILAGGPSLNDHLEFLRTWDQGPIVAAGSTHDHVIKNGIIPDYCVVYDPSPAHVLFLNEKNRETIYFVATTCDPETFDHLADCKVVTWNAAGNVPWDELGDEPAVGGGSSVPLRAFPIMFVLGFRDFHFFGLDSSYPEDCVTQHAYDYEGQEHQLSKGFNIRLPDHGNREFCTNAVLAYEAQQFMRMLDNYGHLFKVTVYGDGMIAHILRHGGSTVAYNGNGRDQRPLTPI